MIKKFSVSASIILFKKTLFFQRLLLVLRFTLLVVWINIKIILIASMLNHNVANFIYAGF